MYKTYTPYTGSLDGQNKKKKKEKEYNRKYTISRGGRKPEIKFFVEFLLDPGVNNSQNPRQKAQIILLYIG